MEALFKLCLALVGWFRFVARTVSVRFNKVLFGRERKADFLGFFFVFFQNDRVLCDAPLTDIGLENRNTRFGAARRCKRTWKPKLRSMPLV